MEKAWLCRGRASAYAPSLRGLGSVNHVGGIDLDGDCRRRAAGEIVCEEQKDGRGEHCPAREEAGTGRQAEIHFREQGMGQRLLDRLVIWRGGEKRESDFRMAQEACCCAEEWKN